MSNSRPPRPDPVSVDVDAVPDKLAQREAWVCWRYSWNSDRDEWTKIPLDVNSGGFAKSTDPDTWVSFGDAVGYHERRDTDTDGIGYVVHEGDTVVGVDLDDCRDVETGELEPWAEQVLADVETYSEVSPSGTGLRQFGLGFLPDGGNRSDIEGADGHLELYETGRYLTVTGAKLDGVPDDVQQVNDEVSELHAQYIADDETENTGESGAVEGDSPASKPTLNGDKPGSSDLSDAELVEKAKNAVNGDKFSRLWSGDTTGYESHSEADLALCGLLSFWSAGDRQRIDQLFRQSDLYREKWDRDDYRERTLDKALKGQSEFYAPGGEGEAVAQPASQDDSLPKPAAFTVRNGGYAKYHPPRDGDGDGWVEQITNFQIETVSRLTHNDGRREFRLRIHPAGGETYTVDAEPTVFNELRTFRRDVLEGWSVTFDGGQAELNALKQFVAGQDAPTREGTKQIGLHGDEFVTPEGSLTADGWVDAPGVVYTDDSSQINPLWRLTPEKDVDDVDRDAVGEILKLLPQTRDSERFLPVLGWFYAAPVRPLVQDWKGQFNLLNVLGDTGAGKTATLEVLWKLFGMESELLTAETTPFTMLTALSSTQSVPVVFDEYKPADMNPRRKDKLHRYLRTTTKGGVESKGNADRTTDNYHLHAPVCLAGEQPIQGPAEERRAILTTFTREGVIGDTPQSRAFTKLTGGKVGGEYYDGLPLTDHALEYYTWLLDQDADELRTLWVESRERVTDLLDDRGHETDVLDDLVIQGFQTVQFGCTLFREFAQSVGVDPDSTGVTAATVADAVVYVAGEGGGADHTSHLDRFLALLGRATAAGYIQPGEHYTVVESGLNGTPELRLTISTAFDQVRRYARDHDVRGEDLLDTANDYRARIRDDAESPDGYVTTTSQPTYLTDSKRARCVGFDLARLGEVVADIDTGVFEGHSTDDADTDSDSDTVVGSTPDIADLSKGYVTFEATVDAVLDPKPWVEAEGSLRDDSGVVDYVVREGSGETPALEEGERYRFVDARVTTDQDGVEIVEIRPGATDVKPATTGTVLDDHSGGDDDQDGDDLGETSSSDDVDDASTPASGKIEPPSGEYATVKGNVMDVLRQNDGEVPAAKLSGVLVNGDASFDDVRGAVESLEQRGRVETVQSDGVELVKIA